MDALRQPGPAAPPVHQELGDHSRHLGGESVADELTSAVSMAGRTPSPLQSWDGSIDAPQYGSSPQYELRSAFDDNEPAIGEDVSGGSLANFGSVQVSPILALSPPVVVEDLVAPQPASNRSMSDIEDMSELDDIIIERSPSVEWIEPTPDSPRRPRRSRSSDRSSRSRSLSRSRRSRQPRLKPSRGRGYLPKESDSK